MARSRALALLAALALGPLVLGACSSSKKTSSTTPTTASSSGGVTVPTSAAGANTVNVTLGDTKGLNAPMTLTPSPTSAPAGDVTFVVKNAGTIEHEMIVLKTTTPFDKLPIVDGGDPPAPVTSGANKVDEGSSAGETGDPNLKASESRTFTIKGLSAGSYVLVCNIAQHYGLGMRAAFTVA